MPGINLVDPTSLPALLQRPPGLVPGPQLRAFQGSTAFRPPQPMAVPPLAMPPPASTGFGIGDGLAAAGGFLRLLDQLTGYRGDPAASTAYGSPRPALPIDALARRGWIGGGV